jgi:hypothetical protein
MAYMSKVSRYLLVAIACFVASGALYLVALGHGTVVLSSSTTIYTNGTLTPVINGSTTTITSQRVTTVVIASIPAETFKFWGGLLLLVGLMALTIGMYFLRRRRRV